jgi:hypothetical protein
VRAFLLDQSNIKGAKIVWGLRRINNASFGAAMIWPGSGESRDFRQVKKKEG